MLRLMNVRRVLAVTALLAVTACAEASAPSGSAESGTGPAEESAALPSYGEVDALPGGLLGGVALTASETDGCLWLTPEGGERLAALWPPGYRVAFNPTRILREDGSTVMNEQDRATMGGGNSPVHVDRLPERCRIGNTAWWVATVRVID
jgi:hypothetical protein